MKKQAATVKPAAKPANAVLKLGEVRKQAPAQAAYRASTCIRVYCIL
ncbi:hypothetical protein [Lysobacter enzymogenes]|nr:hypothetical protein [Lysobacter enzymogenes]